MARLRAGDLTVFRYMSGAEPNAALRVGLVVRQETQVMELTQAFLLGIMVAWTPSLIVLAVLLRDIR
jgi:hypothetical protein